MPKIEVVTWKIVGIKPLLQSNPHVMWIGQEQPDDEKLKPTRRKTLVGTDSENFALCKRQLYVNDDGLHYHPGMAFWHAITSACPLRKIGHTAALTVVTMAVTLIEDEFILYDPTTLDSKKPKPLKGNEWQIDKRRAINHNKNATQGGVGVVAVRPKWKSWGGFLSLEVDMEIVRNLDFLTELMNIGGHNFGAGVGRIRLQGTENRQPKWGGLGTGKFTAELRV